MCSDDFLRNCCIITISKNTVQKMHSLQNSIFKIVFNPCLTKPYFVTRLPKYPPCELENEPPSPIHVIGTIV